MIKKAHLKSFSKRINTLSSHIKFTNENGNEHGELPFLDCLVKRNVNGALNLSIYRKPTHSNRYIDFHSAHSFGAKISLALNLLRRANMIITSEEDEQKEQKNVISILQFNNFPMKIVRSMLKQNSSIRNNNNSNEMPWIGTAVLPYRHGTTEELQRILKQRRIRVYTKTTNALRNT